MLIGGELVDPVITNIEHFLWTGERTKTRSKLLHCYKRYEHDGSLSGKEAGWNEWMNEWMARLSRRNSICRQLLLVSGNLLLAQIRITGAFHPKRHLAGNSGAGKGGTIGRFWPNYEMSISIESSRPSSKFHLSAGWNGGMLWAVQHVQSSPDCPVQIGI